MILSINKKLKIFFGIIFFVVFSISFISFSYADTGVSNIISYQGHLTDTGGNPLGGTSTPYYFKFSFWDSPTVGSGTKLWPSSPPSVTSLAVKQGSFNVNIGDTTAGYPDTLDYNWNTNSRVYLQIEISSDNINFETLTPRSLITSAPYSQVASQVNGVNQSSFGTSTPFLNTVISALSTGVNSVVMAVKGVAGQVANLFNVTDSNNNPFFTVSSNGNVGVGTSTPGYKLDVDGNINLTGSFYKDGNLFTTDNLIEGTSNLYFNNSRARSTLSALSPLLYSSSTGQFSIDQSGAFTNGYLSSIDWNSFNNKVSSQWTAGTGNISYSGGNVGVGTSTPSSKLTIVDTTLSGSGSLANSVLNLAQTWNTTGTPTAINLNVTNTASAGNPLLMNLSVGGVSKFYVDKNGQGVFASSIQSVGGIFSSNIYVRANAAEYRLGASDDIRLARDAAGTLAQRDGVNAQSLHLYNTYTDASNYERAGLNWSGNSLRIGTENAGTGVARTLNLMTASTTRLTIDTSGNVGIGTSSPASMLQIYGSMGSGLDGTDATGIRLTNYPNGYSWRVASGYGGVSHAAFSIGMVGSQPSLTIRADNGGVGIGQTNAVASAKLDITDTSFAGSGSLAGSILNLAQTWNTTGTPTALKLNVTDSSSTASSLLMDLQVGGVSKFKVDKNGVTAIASNLNLTGSLNLAGGLGIYQQSQPWIFPSGSNTFIRSNGSTGNIYFQNQGGTSNYLFMQGSDGNVGIGTTTPSTKLSVVGDGYFGGKITATGAVYASGFGTSANSASFSFIFGTTPSLISSGGQQLRFDGSSLYSNAGSSLGTAAFPFGNGYFSGNIGIGTTTPSAQLHTTGTVRFQNFGAGSLQTDANGNLTVSSDERLKNIQGDFTRGLSDLIKISPISYKWNAQSGLDMNSTYSGFSAQNIQLAIPEAVATSSSGFLTLSDRPIIATLVNAAKEMYSKLMSLFDGTGTVKVKELCLEETCITENQLKIILQNQNIIPAQVVNTGNVNMIIGSSEDISTSTSSSTEPEITSSSTENYIPEQSTNMDGTSATPTVPTIKESSSGDINITK